MVTKVMSCFWELTITLFSNSCVFVEFCYTSTHRHTDTHTHTHTHTLPFLFLVHLSHSLTHFLPPSAQLLPGEVNWSVLAQSYELTGGLIRNAVLSAISLASKMSSTERVTLSEESLNKGAKLQLRLGKETSEDVSKASLYSIWKNVFKSSEVIACWWLCCKY